MEKMKNIISAIKAWDEKHTNFHSATYMGIVIAAASTASFHIQQVAAAAPM